MLEHDLIKLNIFYFSSLFFMLKFNHVLSLIIFFLGKKVWIFLFLSLFFLIMRPKRQNYEDKK
jgi:hypothetical protein